MKQAIAGFEIDCGQVLLSASKIIFGQPGQFHQVFEKADFKRLIAVDRYGKARTTSGSALDAMAALHPQQRPTMAFEDFGKIFAGDGFHIAISNTRSFAPI
jgi:hypothetical protein